MKFPDAHPLLLDLLRQDIGAVHPSPAPDDPVWDAVLHDAGLRAAARSDSDSRGDGHEALRIHPDQSPAAARRARLAALALSLLNEELRRARDTKRQSKESKHKHIYTHTLIFSVNSHLLRYYMINFSPQAALVNKNTHTYSGII